MIDFNFSALKQTKPHQYLVRFVLGGACTAVAGIIAAQFGPVVGGLFLAFPAIFPAGASLIETHEIEKKKQVAADGRDRGRIAASIDATGAALGTIALVAFALVTWRFLSRADATLVITAATGTWVCVALSLWILRRKRFFRSF